MLNCRRMKILRCTSIVLIVLGALAVLTLLYLPQIVQIVWDIGYQIHQKSYPRIIFNFEISGSDIESPRYLELEVEASNLRYHEVESTIQPKKYFHMKSSNGIAINKDGERLQPYIIGEMYIVLSDSIVDKKNTSFTMELGKGILQWSYREYIYVNGYNDTVTFYSSSPTEGSIFVEKLSLVKDTNKFRDRPDLDEYTFYTFEGTFRAKFISDSLPEKEGKRKVIRNIKGDFKLRWFREDRGS